MAVFKSGSYDAQSLFNDELPEKQSIVRYSLSKAPNSNNGLRTLDIFEIL